jgi:uncharacterized protein with PIN domain
MVGDYKEGLDAFLAEAKQSYARMFGPERQAELKTFSQREVCVYEEGRRLSRVLLETHLEQEHESEPQAEGTVLCPRCNKVSQRVENASDEVRPVTTLVGEVSYPRAKYRCRHCRKIFSVGSGPANGPVAAQSGGAQARGGTRRQ